MQKREPLMQNRECPYFPCHPTTNPETFSCKFCYCPLYTMADCGGDFTVTPAGVKDCSNCTWPHREPREVEASIEKRFPQMGRLGVDLENTPERIPDTTGKGYLIVDYDDTGLLNIQRDDDLRVFPDDESAIVAAVTDGIRVIPEEELPENFVLKGPGWLDTPQNRKRIEDWCKTSDNR